MDVVVEIEESANVLSAGDKKEKQKLTARAKAIDQLPPEDRPFAKPYLSFEFGLYLAIVLVAYWLLGSTMHGLSQQWKSQLSLRENGFGWLVDRNDYQWRAFVRSLPLFLCVGAGHILLTRAAQWAGWPVLVRALVQVAYAAVFCGIAHRGQAAVLLAVLLVFYAILSLLVRTGQSARLVQAYVWAFGLGVLFTVHLRSDVFHLSNWLGVSYAWLDREMHTWVMTWNFILLRSVSFAVDWVFARDNVPQRPLPSDHALVCDQCKVVASDSQFSTESTHVDGAGCLTKRVRQHQPTQFYSLPYFLAYVFYVPLYVAGPILTFNAFVSQLRSPPVLTHMWTYAARWCGCLLLMELLTSWFHVWALRNLNLFGHHVSTSDLGVLAYWCLVMLWMKFTVIWRFFRAWSLLAGIEAPENMGRCINNNYTMSGFWRGWHASFNAWLVRYLYIPLGGSNFKYLNLWVVFLFVAVWHEVEWRLLVWALVVCAVFLPEFVLTSVYQSAWFRQSSFWVGWRSSFLVRLAFAFLASASILLMMAVNLVGFFVGTFGVQRLLTTLLFGAEARQFLLICLVSLSAAAMLMFKIRVDERIARTTKLILAKSERETPI